MINWSQIPEPPIRKQKISMLFTYIDEELNNFLEKITNIYKQNGIKYYVKPHHQFFMRLLIPSQLKVFTNLTDILCLFGNRNSLMQSVLLKKNQVADQSISVKKMDNRYMEGIIRNKICEWAKVQVLNGKDIIRNDVKMKVQQIAQKYNLRYGSRWLKQFLSHDPELIHLLTHANCTKSKKNNKELNEKNEKKQFSYHSFDQKKIKQGQEKKMNNDNDNNNDEYSSAYGAYQDDQFIVEQNYWQDDQQKYQIFNENERYPDERNQKKRKENNYYRENFRQKSQKDRQKKI